MDRLLCQFVNWLEVVLFDGFDQHRGHVGAGLRVDDGNVLSYELVSQFVKQLVKLLRV